MSHWNMNAPSGSFEILLVEGKDVHLEEFIRGMILDEQEHLRT